MTCAGRAGTANWGADVEGARVEDDEALGVVLGL